MISQKNIMYILMTLLVFAWGFEYVVAKNALETLDPFTLMFFKYGIGFLVILVIKLKLDKILIRMKDIPMFLACAIFGDIGYFYFEYSAMDYLPISLITILLSFVPIASLLTERVLYKKSITRLMTLGAITCTIGVMLVIGADFGQMLSGRLIGYGLAFGAVTTWNAFNFITASMHDRYTSITVTFYQLTFAILLLFPYAMTHLPSVADLDKEVIFGVIYLGIFSAGIGFYIQVKALHILGVTPAAMFSNFMPITSTFFGWVLLDEWISSLQFLGGVIIITSAAVVIREKERIGTEKP